MVHTIGMYHENNALVQESISKFMAAAGHVAQEGAIEILAWRGRLYLQGEKLAYRRETVALINAWLDFFEQRTLAGFRLFPKIKDAPPGELVRLSRLLNESTGQEEPAAWIEGQLSAHQIDWVEVLQDVETLIPEGDAETYPQADAERIRLWKKKSQENYFRALESVKEVSQKMTVQSRVGIRKIRRLAQNMVELLLEDESLMHCLATIRDYDDYTYTHSVNVAILSLCIGRRIGLNPILLEQLGVCGMFHDLGKVEISKEILHKPGKLAPEEWHLMQKHPMIGVLHILKLHAPSEMKARVALGPFEHHLKTDLTGYPKTHFTKNITLFGRILSIADTYDALTSFRAYRIRSLAPSEALGFMWFRLRQQFDPILLKVFLKMMGPYPVGSVVQLNTGETGIVTPPGGSEKEGETQVLLLTREETGAYRKGDRITVRQSGGGADEDARWIHSCIPAAGIGIQPAELLLQ